jgi:hypothetical protein
MIMKNFQYVFQMNQKQKLIHNMRIKNIIYNSILRRLEYQNHRNDKNDKNDKNNSYL